jgi:hypothetical protein
MYGQALIISAICYERSKYFLLNGGISDSLEDGIDRLNNHMIDLIDRYVPDTPLDEEECTGDLTCAYSGRKHKPMLWQKPDDQPDRWRTAPCPGKTVRMVTYAKRLQ